MTAKEMFEELGYEQKIHKSDLHPSCDGIQYIKKDPEERMEFTGMVTTKVIEFYYMHKEILIATTYKHRSGTESKSDSGVLSLEEFKAVQKQTEELGW